MRHRLVVIGGGASGLFLSSLLGKKPLILERNPSAGKKLLLTGGTRCNYTHLEPNEELITHYRGDKRLVKSLIYDYSPKDIINHLKSIGIEPKNENGKIYPSSERSIDVLNALLKGANIKYNTMVHDIEKHNGFFLVHTNSEIIECEKLVIATGGNSYPKTGSDGNGYALLRRLGHRITPICPALSPLILKDSLTSARGITLEVEIKTESMYSRGSSVITDQGISGPAAENISWALSSEKEIEISFTQNPNPIDKRKNSLLKNSLGLPAELITALMKSLADKKTSALTKRETEYINKRLTSFRTMAKSTYKGAMSTHGGVSTDEIDRNTLESKIIENLFIAGDLLDIDGDTGGYSLTIAFSSAHKIMKAISK